MAFSEHADRSHKDLVLVPTAMSRCRYRPAVTVSSTLEPGGSSTRKVTAIVVGRNTPPNTDITTYSPDGPVNRTLLIAWLVVLVRIMMQDFSDYHLCGIRNVECLTAATKNLFLTGSVLDE